MLDPDYLEQAGEKVASVYTQIESEMLDYLSKRMIDGDITNQRSMTALYSLAQSSALPLANIIKDHGKDINAAVALEVTDAINRSDKDDLTRLKRGLGVDIPTSNTQQVALTIAGVKKILERQNLNMNEGARKAFLDKSIWAVTQVSTGAMTTEQALHAAVRKLESEGITIISYRNAKTGKQTVNNKVDVAIRRHIRTQIAQDGMRRTETLLDEAGVELVEVSSHGGSRPSHAKWEGRIYSRHGDRVIDGVKYRDFRSACNWGDIADGIGGANCRHSYAAWFPGMERSYEPDPPHPSGLSNEEVYNLNQEQRRREREIRETKRELRGAELSYDSTKSLESQAEVSRLKLKLKDQQASMRKLISENDKVLQRSPRREWAGDMPNVKVPKGGISMMVAEPKRIKSGLASKRTTKIDTDLIDSKQYRKAYDFFKDKDVGDAVCNEAREMLKHRNGTSMEDFSAISISGKSAATRLKSAKTNKMAKLSHENIRVIENSKRGDLITLHNHPESMPPSFSDFSMLRNKAFRYGIIACHNGDVIRYRITNRDRFLKVIADGRGEEIDAFFLNNMLYYGIRIGNATLARNLERKFGVSYEYLT